MGLGYGREWDGGAGFLVTRGGGGCRYAAYVMREVLSKRSEQFRITEVRGSAGPSAYGWGAGAGKMPPPGFAGEGSHA